MVFCTEHRYVHLLPQLKCSGNNSTG